MKKDLLDEKRKRFKTVGARRVQKVLDGLENLSKCSNKRNYEYSEDDVKKMLKVINEKLIILKSSFSIGTGSEKNEFEF